MHPIEKQSCQPLIALRAHTQQSHHRNSTFNSAPNWGFTSTSAMIIPQALTHRSQVICAPSVESQGLCCWIPPAGTRTVLGREEWLSKQVGGRCDIADGWNGRIRDDTSEQPVSSKSMRIVVAKESLPGCAQRRNSNRAGLQVAHSTISAGSRRNVGVGSSPAGRLSPSAD